MAKNDFNKLAKAWKTRTSPGTLGLKKFGLGKLCVKKFSEKTLKENTLSKNTLSENTLSENTLSENTQKLFGSSLFNFSRRATRDADRMEIRNYYGSWRLY